MYFLILFKKKSNIKNTLLKSLVLKGRKPQKNNIKKILF